MESAIRYRFISYIFNISNNLNKAEKFLEDLKSHESYYFLLCYINTS